MTRRFCLVAVVVLGAMLMIGGCGRQGEAEPAQPVQPAAQEQAPGLPSGEGKEAKMAWTLASSAFKEWERIPRKYTCEGENVSPPLSWTAAPAKTDDLALVCDDPDAPRGTFVHWVLYGLPATTTSLPEAVPTTETLPKLGGAKQGKNGMGTTGYTGPCPPPGPAHHYHFILYALDVKVALKPGATEEQLRKAMQGHIVEETELVGLYGR